MADRLDARKAVLAKIEATYGTDATPTGALNAIQTSGVTPALMQGDTLQRNLDSPNLGGDLTYHVAPYTAIEFRVELAGAGAAGTAPAYGPLLRACGFAEAVNAGTSVVYTPVSSAFESATIYYFRDGTKHALVGARGSVRFEVSGGGIPVMVFRFLGLRVAPAAVANPTVDWSRFKTPKPVTSANTPTFTLHGFAAPLYECTIDMANEVVYDNVAGGSESVKIVDRDANGSVLIADPALGDKDYHAIINAHTTGALQLIHGVGAGNIVQFDAPAVQLLQPAEEERQKVAALRMVTRYLPNAGNDEISLTIK